MSKILNLKVGSILSEISFYTVNELPKYSSDPFVLKDSFGNEIKMGSQYVDKILVSADHFEKEEKKTKTELADLFINSPRMAITVAFFKQDTPKTKKAYNAEKQAKIDEITNARVSDVASLLSDLIDNPIMDYTPGELRVMKGYHEGHMDDLGRVKFTDMEVTSGHNLRQVDPRSIQYVIVQEVKYTLKK